ncbi:hypothetical protein GALMADRAFT_249435 [Galerina marginata CBS 339.88]|uniref:Queuosine 5'-phosphate N-glycosylase/hydrolase n=1 Tax=Galerina marginata (strain CBS 339.88) TaxID=685588 RepID=A0A067T640_GALM3|nr:hypothetical protein GALMADRAFT_249435 [Galerina marginata CBS 339.88]
MPSLPPSGGYLQAIRDSSRVLCAASGVAIKAEHIKRLLLSPAFLDSFRRVSQVHGLALPLNFSSNVDELNFLSVLSLLNFASGFRVPLHAQTSRGAWDSIRALLFSMYITSTTGEGDLLSAKGLRTIDISKIAEFMGVSLHVERPHDTIPGVVVGELGGPLYQLVELIASVLNETGRILEDTGYPDLGSFVAETLERTRKLQANDDAAVDFVLETLVRAFPGFRDMSEVNGQPIYCFKKALFLIHAINIRFGSISPPPFPIPSTTNIPVFADNVLPSLLVHLGVIDLSSTLSLSGLFPPYGSEMSLEHLLGSAPASTKAVSGVLKMVPEEGPFVTPSQSYILRAAAINACELIVKTAQSLDATALGDGGEHLDWISKITLPSLDMWIWAVAKDRPDYRVLKRFVDRDTVYF